MTDVPPEFVVIGVRGEIMAECKSLKEATDLLDEWVKLGKTDFSGIMPWNSSMKRKQREKSN
jgi:hypothetical protein